MRAIGRDLIRGGHHGQRHVDGRIDDTNAGWKGREIWTTYGSRTNFHMEGGKGNKPRAVKLQLRPDPLAH
jgi:hypothetical protein